MNYLSGWNGRMDGKNPWLGREVPSLVALAAPAAGLRRVFPIQLFCKVISGPLTNS